MVGLRQLSRTQKWFCRLIHLKMAALLAKQELRVTQVELVSVNAPHLRPKTLIGAGAPDLPPAHFL